MLRFVGWFCDRYFRHFFPVCRNKHNSFLLHNVCIKSDHFAQLFFIGHYTHACHWYRPIADAIHTLIFMFVPFECMFIDDMNMNSAYDWVRMIVFHTWKCWICRSMCPNPVLPSAHSISISLWIRIFFVNILALCYLFRIYCTAGFVDWLYEVESFSPHRFLWYIFFSLCLRIWIFESRDLVLFSSRIHKWNRICNVHVHVH